MSFHCATRLEGMLPRLAISLAGAAMLLALAGCGEMPRPPVAVTWVVGQGPPAFDPQGPPDAVRAALERLLSRGLVEEDSTGRILPAAAESLHLSPDGLVYTFALRRGLAFSDGRPCESGDFRGAIERGVNRLDHSTTPWLLGAVVGMDRVRPGRPLPPLGIATPDPRTLVLRLARPDSLLLRKLALPGVGVPWRSDGGAGGWRDGVGDYRIETDSPGRLTLVRRGARVDLPDTIHVRFLLGAARVRALLRAGAADVVWPLPPDLLDQPLPGDYRARSTPARPVRRLLLVQRADLPPTTRIEARQALAHGLDRGQLVGALGASGTEPGGWLPGGGTFDFPRRDPAEVQAWLERGRLGRSMHVVMAYSADGPAARVARVMQVEWARLGLDVELRPFRQPRPVTEWMRRGGAQLLLLESQSLLDSPAADMAMLVEPLRGPAIGGFRTGWRTREFDRWIAGTAHEPLDAGWAQQRLAEERVALPLARLPWVWVEPSHAPLRHHPRFGPELRGRMPSPITRER